MGKGLWEEEDSSAVVLRVDQDKDGYISPSELRNVFLGCGVWVSEDACIKFVERYTEHFSGVPREEFQHLWTAATTFWNQLDVDHDGYVTATELERILPGAARLIPFMDANGNGKISFPEFLFAVDLRAANVTESLANFAAGSDFSMLLQTHPGDSVKKILVAGTLAGALSKTFMSPFSRIVIILQVSAPDIKAHQAVLDIVRGNGLMGLFRGNVPGIFRLAPATAIHQSFYAKLKRYHIQKGTFGIKEEFLCGCLGGAVSLTATMPLDVVRTRMSLVDSHSSILGTARDIFRHSGIRGLYAGLPMALAEAAPYMGIQMIVLEYLRPKIRRYLTVDLSVKDYLVTVGAASVAAMAGALCTYPLVSIRRNQQIQPDLSWTQTSQFLYRHGGGVRRFYKGIGLYLTSVVPTVAVALTSFEALKRNLNL